jgi:hypothetical protein
MIVLMHAMAFACIYLLFVLWLICMHLFDHYYFYFPSPIFFFFWVKIKIMCMLSAFSLQNAHNLVNHEILNFCLVGDILLSSGLLLIL